MRTSADDSASRELDEASHRRDGKDGNDNASRLNRLRLLVALDALLVEGSVGGAAHRLGVGTPAMSRLLGQLRQLYDDPILIRTGRGMVPTPLAESMRQRVRTVANETEALFGPAPQATAKQPKAPVPGMEARLHVQSPPLAMRPAVLVEGEPGPEAIAAKFDALETAAEPYRRLARAIALMGGGAGRSRPLTRPEAEEALSIVLEGEADPIQIGALLVVMQYRGATADELAGLVTAARTHCSALEVGSGVTDLDWPVYISPKVQMPPWFLHAARLVAQAGHKVVLHGQSGTTRWLDSAISLAGIPAALSVAEGRSVLNGTNLVYLPLSGFGAQLHALLSLYRLLELRSPLNMLVHLINPLGAKASLLGVSSSAYPACQRDAAKLLGWRHLTILGGRRDVAQFTPYRSTPVYRLVDGEPGETVIASRRDPGPAGRTALSSLEYWDALWRDGLRDERARDIILTTTASALQLLKGHGSLADHMAWAETLWRERRG